MYSKEEKSSGFFNDCDNSQLEPSSPCIIVILGTDGYLNGILWGETVQFFSNKHKTCVLEAKINGGKFSFDCYGKPIKSDEQKDEIPSNNYHVYPDTKTNRDFLQVQMMQNDIIVKSMERYNMLVEMLKLTK